LRATGFRKSGRTHNRRVGDGLVHVVSLQMGQYVSGQYGKFAINLGVYLPCVPEIEYGRSASKTIHEYSCEIRDRLGALAFSRKDVWWELDASVGKTAALICRLMDE